ncbi:hypothetical protein DFAR_2910059 [Desulfarculales bacterium]
MAIIPDRAALEQGGAWLTCVASACPGPVFLGLSSLEAKDAERDLLCQWAGARGLKGLGHPRGDGPGAPGSGTTPCPNLHRPNRAPRTTARWSPYRNDERNESPDVDLDFDSLRRDEVLRYVMERFPGGTAMIADSREVGHAFHLKRAT